MHRINVMEGNNHHDGTDFKPARKFIQIDSIYIDLFSSDHKCDDQKCELFSIRGYVSDMRKKDWKICWPFSHIDNGHKLDEPILSAPPVFDPSFDRHRGRNHWQESSGKVVDQCFLFDSCNNLGKFANSSLKAPNQDVNNGRPVADNASNSTCQHCDQIKEKKLDVTDNCTVALISQSEPGCASHGVTEIESVSGNLILKATEDAALQDGKRTPADRLNGQLTLVVSENDSTVDAARGHHTVELQENGDASMESNESTVSSYESAETVGNSPHHCHLGKLHRRRTRKIRLLTDLLGDNGNMLAKHVESSPSNEFPEASVQADVRYASKCQVTIEEDIWHSDHKRERRLPRNRKCRDQEIPSSSSVDKQIQTWRGEIESSVSSLGTENALSGMKKTMKGPSSSYKMDGNNSLRRKKSKNFSVVDPYSVSLLSSKVKDQCGIRAVIENRSEVAVDSAAILAHHNEFSSRTPHSISLNAMESKSSTFKNPNSSKEPGIFEGSTNVCPRNNEILRRGSVAQKDLETMTSRSVASPSPNYKNTRRELHLSLSNYSDAQRNHKGLRRQGENELPTFLPEQDDTSGVSKLNDIETRNLGHPNHPHQTSDVFCGQGVQNVLNSEMANLRMPLPRQNADPLTKNSWSQLQNKDVYRRGNGKRTIEAQEPLALKKRQINQRMDQASDRGNSDDIPMEIVELMAKNQYERRLPDVENNYKHVSQTGKFSRAVQVNNYGDVYRNGRELLQKPENFKQNAQARNGRNGAIRAETRKQKSADYISSIGESHFDTNHPQQNHMLRCNGSIHSLEEPSNGIQYSSIGSKRKSCTEIRKCNGTTVESGPYNPKVHSSEGCIDHLPVSEQNIEAAYIWSSSSLMPDHLSNGYQKFPAHSTDSRKISSPRSFQMGNANAQNHHNHHSTNLERHGRHNNSEAYSQRFAESSFCRRPNVVELHHNPVGSLELYSNETILALHLLSLMDARMQSHAPITTGEKHKSSKKPPVPRPREGKEFSAMDICFNTSNQNINQFPSAFHDEVCISPTSTSASTFQDSRGFGTDTNFSGQAVFRSLNGAKMKCSDPYSWSKDQKLSKSQFISGHLRTDDSTFPVNGIGKGIVNASNSEAFMLAHHMERNSEECKLVAHTRTLQNEKIASETEICSVNKNPADFSLPEAGNIYMIGAEDFNFRRTLLSKYRSSSIYFNDRYKQQRIV